ncbi:aminotransferase class V-fold PLP-dependent enzyme [bacterium]|nr:aminotransferase class V-fold PLP-dependent enzyme [bacterium]
MPFFKEAPPAPAIQPTADFPAFLERYRASQPSIQNFLYLNHASVGPLSDWVIAAVNEQLAQQQMADSVDQDPWFDGWRLSRQRVAEYIGATDRSEVCLLSSTHTALLRAFQAIPIEPGDEVICPADDFPSLYTAMSELTSRGAVLRAVPSGKGDGIVRTADMLAAITPKTKVVALSWVNFFHGYTMDLAAIGRAARANGSWYAVDCMQGLGALTIDVKATGANFIAGHGAKWLCAPLASGFLWVDPQLDPEQVTPRTDGWFALELNHLSYTDRSVKPKHNANRFSLGTVPFPSAFGLRRACEIFLEAGPQRVEERAIGYADGIADCVRDCGLDLYYDRSEHRSAILSFTLPAGSPLSDVLKGQKVIHSVREGKLRLSPHWYHSDAEIDSVCEIIRESAKVQV